MINYEIIPNDVIGVPQIDETFPIVFRFIGGDFNGWFVCLESVSSTGRASFYVLKVPKDVTDKQVKRSEKKLKKLFEKIIKGIIEADNDGHFKHNSSELTI